MAPRKRSISDTDLLTAAGAVLGERGVEGLRLADVAAVTQLAPATLVQRFGSREGLLAALAATFIAEIGGAFSVHADSRVDALARALHHIDAPRHLRFFLARPALGAASYALELRKHIGFSLVAAIEAGEIVRCDVAEHARQIQLGYFGLVTVSVLEGVNIDLRQLQQLVDRSLADYR